MDLLQDLLDRLPVSGPGSGSGSAASGARSQSRPVYQCTNCKCTFTSRLERCRECQTGRLVRSGRRSDSNRD